MFVVLRDFQRLKNATELSVLLNEEGYDANEILKESMDFAVEYIKSKLQHRYDPDQIFIDITAFDVTAAYVENDLIYYTETAFDSASTYSIDERVLYGSKIYKANTSVGTGAFNTGEWDFVVNNSLVFFAADGGTGNYPEDTDYWTQQDTRNPLIKDYCIKLALKELYQRVNPRVMPEWVMTEADRAESHLNRINSGKDTVILPLYLDSDGDEEDDKGQNIVSGSETQKNWNF